MNLEKTKILSSLQQVISFRNYSGSELFSHAKTQRRKEEGNLDRMNKIGRMIEGFIWIGTANPDKSLGALIKNPACSPCRKVKNTFPFAFLRLCAKFLSLFASIAVLSSYKHSYKQIKLSRLPNVKT